MSNFYLGSTELNEFYLNNDQVGRAIQPPISSLFQVFPSESVANYWNQLSASYFEIQGTFAGGTSGRILKWYDSITNSYISSSNFYPLSGQTPLGTVTVQTVNATASYVGIGDGGENARAFLAFTEIQNNNFSATSNDQPINLTGSFSVFFTINQDIPTNGASYSALPISLTNNVFNRLNWVVARDQPTGNAQVYWGWFGQTNPSGSTNTEFVAYSKLATTASVDISGWWGFTFNDITKEVSTYYNSATPTLITSSGTFDSPNLNFLFDKKDFFSADRDPTTTNIVELTVLNTIPTQLEIENYNAWSRTTYSSLY